MLRPLAIAVTTTIITSCVPVPSNYTYSRPGREVFYSDFGRSNPKFWTGNDGNQEAYTKDGDYFFHSLKDEDRFNAPPFEVGKNRDFEIESAVAGPAGTEDKAFGILLGDFSGRESFLYFKIDRHGKYSLILDHLLTEGRISAASPASYKKLTIRKVGSKGYFFINENYTYSYELPEINVFRAGVTAGEAQMVWADYFRVTEF